jgi:signal transduction histidine kinase
VIQSALVVALATLGAGLAIAFALRALPTLRLRLAGLAVLAVCVPLVAVLASGWVMFHMGDDVKILAVSAASASVALAAALVLARSIERPIEKLGDAAAELASGDLAARAPEDGPAEIASLARAFNEMGDALERIFDARRELFAWASHDLRTPLANMQAMLEALEDGLAEPEHYLPAFREQVRVLSQLVDDLFELARIESGVLALELRELPITPVVESCLVGVAAEAASRGVRLESVGPSDATARFAPEKIERVLLNLLTNALRHTPDRRLRGRRREAGADDELPSASRTRARASTTRGWSGCSSASGAATRRARHPERVRPRHRARSGRGARRADLGRAAHRRRHERLVHASRLIAGRHRSYSRPQRGERSFDRHPTLATRPR